MNSPAPRSYPKRGQRTAVTSYSSNRRGQRRSAGIPSRTHPNNSTTSETTTTTTSQKWTRVMRNPISPLDEPYFGSTPTASFQVPTWVRVSDLTEEEKAHYDSMMEKRQAAVVTQLINGNDKEINESADFDGKNEEKMEDEPSITNDSTNEAEDDKTCANTEDEGVSGAQSSSNEQQAVVNMKESLNTNDKDEEEVDQRERNAQHSFDDQQTGVNINEDNNDQAEFETKQTTPNSTTVETHVDEATDDTTAQSTSDEPPEFGVNMNGDDIDQSEPMQKKQKLLSDSINVETDENKTTDDNISQLHQANVVN